MFGRPSEWTSQAADIETGGCHYYLHSLKIWPVTAVPGRLLSFGEHVHIVWLCVANHIIAQGAQRLPCRSPKRHVYV